MIKMYYVKFGQGNSRDFTGLAPVFDYFIDQTGAAVTPPVISEIGISTGIYGFTFGPTLSLTGQVDGGPSIPLEADRYVQIALDPIQAVDTQVGTVNDSFGTNVVDPSTIFGHVKRALEFLEGNATFNKSTGAWGIYSRGSSQLLREKQLTNTATDATKS